MFNFKKIGIVALSNGIHPSKKNEINSLLNTLKNLNLNYRISNFIFCKELIFNGSPKEKAMDLHTFFTDDSIDAIFDISGGDMCNSLLEFLDFDLIKNHPKPFFGYSDLTVLLNALYTKSNLHTFNYQLRNIINDSSKIQETNFNNSLIKGTSNGLFDFNFNFISGSSMEGILIGGNIRCFLKLAGTPFMPSFDEKILFLEAQGGDISKICTYLYQLKNLGAFKKINGLILGTFTELEKSFQTSNNLILDIINTSTLPIAKTFEIGHSKDSKCLKIGSFLSL